MMSESPAPIISENKDEITISQSVQPENKSIWSSMSMCMGSFIINLLEPCSLWARRKQTTRGVILGRDKIETVRSTINEHLKSINEEEQSIYHMRVRLMDCVKRIRQAKIKKEQVSIGKLKKDALELLRNINMKEKSMSTLKLHVQVIQDALTQTDRVMQAVLMEQQLEPLVQTLDRLKLSSKSLQRSREAKHKLIQNTRLFNQTIEQENELIVSMMHEDDQSDNSEQDNLLSENLNKELNNLIDDEEVKDIQHTFQSYEQNIPLRGRNQISNIKIDNDIPPIISMSMSEYTQSKSPDMPETLISELDDAS